MIDSKTKEALNDIGQKLSLILPEFYGKVTFNYYDGHYVCSNVELSVKPDNFNKGAKND